MTNPRSISEVDIRSRCQEIIDISSVDRFGGYEAFAALQDSPDLPVIEPVMAAAFAESIQHGCRALGAVTGEELPDIEAFLPDERMAIAQARQVLPAMTPQDMLAVRRIHRANARAARELLKTFAAHGPDQARELFQHKTAANNSAKELLMMLWGIAVTVQRQTRTPATGRAGRPTSPPMP